MRDHIVRAHHINDLAGLVGDHRLIRHQQRLEGLRCKQSHVAEHSGGEKAIRIVEHSPSANRAGALIQRVVEEIDSAFPSVFGFVLQADVDRIGARVSGLALIFEERRLGRIEDEADRILRHDRRKRGALRSHKITCSQPPIRNPPGDGRRDTCE